MKSTFTLLSVFLLLCTVIVIEGCSKDPEIIGNRPEPPVYDINFRVPAGWPQPVYSFQANPLSEAGFRLGRKLFYEPRLSRDNTISCGSCHQNFAAFAHSAHPVSHGIEGLLGNRNSPGIFNMNWHPSFMWDGGVNHIEVQPLAPITNPIEMDENINNVVSKLSADPGYKKLFKDAFGSEEVNSQRIFKAMAQFMGMLNSTNSKYDKYMRGEADAAFTASELNGLNLFRQKCASCHKEPLFSDFSFRNNGILINAALKDSGRAHITGKASDMYTFKVPSLRNVAFTAPYMHDGRFQTLGRVLDHYSSGKFNTINLDSSLTGGGIPLSPEEKQDLINFMNTLSDHAFIRDERFKDPFGAGIVH